MQVPTLLTFASLLLALLLTVTVLVVGHPFVYQDDVLGDPVGLARLHTQN